MKLTINPLPFTPIMPTHSVRNIERHPEFYLPGGDLFILVRSSYVKRNPSKAHLLTDWGCSVPLPFIFLDA